jgi:hypothetical protein
MRSCTTTTQLRVSIRAHPKLSQQLCRRFCVTAHVRRPVAICQAIDTSHPGDMSGLTAWLEAHPAATVRCVLGKTEGNGCVNDFTRGYAAHAVQQALASAPGTHPAAIIMSGLEKERGALPSFCTVICCHPQTFLYKNERGEVE